MTPTAKATAFYARDLISGGCVHYKCEDEDMSDKIEQVEKLRKQIADDLEEKEREKTRLEQQGKPTAKVDEDIHRLTLHLDGVDDAMKALRAGKTIDSAIEDEQGVVDADRKVRDAAAGPARAALNNKIQDEEKKIDGKRRAKNILASGRTDLGGAANWQASFRSAVTSASIRSSIQHSRSLTADCANCWEISRRTIGWR
jgi:hypothetical protein